VRVFLNTSHVSFVLLFDGLKNHSSCRFLARFIVKMVAGRGSGLPRQSARWLAGLFIRKSSCENFTCWKFLAIRKTMLLKLLLVSCMFLLARNSAQRSTHLECWLLTFTKESDPVSLERLAGFLFLQSALLSLESRTPSSEGLSSKHSAKTCSKFGGVLCFLRECLRRF